MTGARRRPLSDVEVLRAIFDGADTYDAMVLRLGRKDHAVRAVAKRLERRGLPLVRSRSRAPSNRLHYRITALGFRVLKGEA